MESRLQPAQSRDAPPKGGTPTIRWTQITGSDAIPLVPAGAGLPSNLINDVLVSRSGTVFVATTCGLAASKDRGKNWAFVRGADWAAKVKGLYGGPPRGWREVKVPFTLTEDYCTRLAEDSSGLLWIGHRQTGFEAIDPTSLDRRFDSRRGLSPVAESAQQKGTVPLGRPKNSDENGSPDYVTAMLSTPNGPPLVGWYGNGLSPDLSATSPGDCPLLRSPRSKRGLSPSPRPSRTILPPLARRRSMN